MNVPSIGHNCNDAVANWFENTYKCSECETTWTDEWSCTCNDRCPECNAEIEPSSSIDLSKPLSQEDYQGAARLLALKLGVAPFDVTPEDAKAYAEAILEGGEDRFSSPRWEYAPGLARSKHTHRIL
jgi:hypothetical protein